ncbi:MAG: hypothetical protein JWR51_4656 [Devosia sp.]|nr:hypothetical protein [Devosia sp.]
MAVTLGEALMSACAKGMIGGYGAVGAAPDAGKNAEAEAPASYQGGVDEAEAPGGGTSANRDHGIAALLVSRNMDRATPTRSPSAARSIFLVIDNEGGGRRQGGRTSAADRSTAERGRRSKLVVIEGGHQCTASA